MSTTRESPRHENQFPKEVARDTIRNIEGMHVGEEMVVRIVKTSRYLVSVSMYTDRADHNLIVAESGDIVYAVPEGPDNYLIRRVLALTNEKRAQLLAFLNP